MKQLIAFDLDGTLAESKAPLDDEVAGLLATLLTFAQVAVMPSATCRRRRASFMLSPCGLRHDLAMGPAAKLHADGASFGSRTRRGVYDNKIGHLIFDHTQRQTMRDRHRD